MSFSDISPDILDLGEEPLRSTAIEHVDYIEYLTNAPNQLSNIELLVRNQDQWTLPCEAFLQIKGRLTKADGTTPYAAADDATMANTLMGLFTAVRLVANGVEVEAINQYVDVAALIQGFALFSRDFSETTAGGQWWYRDTADSTDAAPTVVTSVYDAGPPIVVTSTSTANPNFNKGFAARKALTAASNGYFSARIPLSALFGFCRDVRKMMYGVQWQLFLQRAVADGDAVVRAAGTDAAKVTISRLSLWMPNLKLSLASATQANQWILNNSAMTMYWQRGQMNATSQFTTSTPSWKITALSSDERPRHIFIAFQRNGRRDSQTENGLIFDTIGASKVEIVYGGRSHPQSSVQINYTEKDYSEVYGWLLSFMGRDHNVDAGTQLSFEEFGKIAPIYHFDLEFQEEGLAGGVKELELRAVLDSTAAANGYKIYAFLMADRTLTLSSDGMRMCIR